MSSILDALRKLEEEKAHQPSAPPPHPVDPDAMDPVPRRGHTRRTKRRKPERPLASQVAWIAVPLGVFVLGVGGAAFWNTSPSDPDQSANVAALTPEDNAVSLLEQRDARLERVAEDLRSIAVTDEETADETVPIIVTDGQGPVDRPVIPDSSGSREVEVLPVTNETSQAQQPVRVTEPEPLPVAEPEPVQYEAPEPEPEPVQYEAPEPEPIETYRERIVVEEFEPYEPPPAPEPERGPSEGFRRAMEVQEAVAQTEFEEETPSPEPVEEDIRRYDIMSRTVMARLNIPELKINMLMQPNERNPLAAALIDYNKVYVGETIPNTHGRAHLIGVDIRGIAIEVEGHRYYYPK